jgi:hypothetical protein
MSRPSTNKKGAIQCCSEAQRYCEDTRAHTFYCAQIEASTLYYPLGKEMGLGVISLLIIQLLGEVLSSGQTTNTG